MSYASAREWSALKGILPRVFSSPAMRFAGQLFSFPAQVVAGELFRPNPWGDKSSPMYGKGPGSLEYAQTIENANSAGRTTPIETDYVTPTVTQKVDNFLTNSVAANIAANEADKEAVSQGNMTAAEYFGTNIEPASSDLNATQGVLSPKEAWLAKTANSPAANAGFDPDVRWQLHQKNQDFQEAKRTGTLDEFALKYPNSQTAKRLNWDPRQGRPF